MTTEGKGRGRRWPRPSTRRLMALLGVLALGLGAVAAHRREAREREREAGRALCVFLLRQVGMALEHYAQQEGGYPPGTVPAPDVPPGRRLGWGVTLLPWFEDGSGEPSTARRGAWDEPGYRHLDAHLYRFMKCPSCDRPPDAPGLKPASFIAIAGLGTDAPGLPRSDRRAGVFGDDRSATPAQIRDGLANTAMVAESSAPSGPWFAGGRSTVRGLDPARKPYLGPGRPFGGIHGAGANVLMADGSVRWVVPTPTGRGFEAMSTIAGGEAAADPDDTPR